MNKKVKQIYVEQRKASKVASILLADCMDDVKEHYNKGTLSLLEDKFFVNMISLWNAAALEQDSLNRITDVEFNYKESSSES